MGNSKHGQPWWETAVMGGSFLLLWAWFLARQAAYKVPGGHLWFGWHVLLALALAALVVVTVRRVGRVRRAMLGEDQDQAQKRGGPPLPFGPMNGRPLNGRPPDGYSKNGAGRRQQ